MERKNKEGTYEQLEMNAEQAHFFDKTGNQGPVVPTTTGTADCTLVSDPQQPDEPAESSACAGLVVKAVNTMNSREQPPTIDEYHLLVSEAPEEYKKESKRAIKKFRKKVRMLQGCQRTMQ